MKRKISTTLAVTLITSQMQGIAIAQEPITNKKILENSIDNIQETTKETTENTNTTPVTTTGDNIDTTTPVTTTTKDTVESTTEETTSTTTVKVTGKLELDINFAMPIKYTTKGTTNINVVLKDSKGDVVKSIDLGKDGNEEDNIINGGVNYYIEALNSKKETLTENETDVSFYHVSFENLELGTYSLEVSGEGYKTAVIDDIEISDTSKIVSIGTSDNVVVLDDKGTTDTTDDTTRSYEGVFLAGDVDANDLVTQSDYEAVKSLIKSNKTKSNINYDLNRDGKIDITDLTYIHTNIDKQVGEALIEDSDIIVNPDNVDVTVPESVQVEGNIKDLFSKNEYSVTFKPKNTSGSDVQAPISKENPIQVPIVLNKTRNTNKVEQVVIKAPSESAPSLGNIVIPGAGENGGNLVVDFGDENIKRTRAGEDEIVIDLGKQVAVSQITINVTGSRSNKNLTEISQVEFLNNVYKEIPKPKMNIPVINKFESATAVGQEHMILGWDHQPNVTGYELKVEELNENGTVKNTSTYKTNKNSLRIDKVNGYSTYRVSIQSLNGTEWKSGYKDEQEDYKKTTTGPTNLANNVNDKDGKPDNADKNYITQAWDSKTGVLSESASNTVEDAYTESLKGANNYGSDSIVELQVIPETVPEGPEGIMVNGKYKGLNISWKSHKKAKDYDLYYRKVGEGAWTKANDTDDTKYVDSVTTNDIPDNVANLSPDKKTDKGELIRGTSYIVNGLEDGATYEIKMTATNHHGTGDLSKTYLGKTEELIIPKLPKYKLINTDSDGDLTSHIEKVEFSDTNPRYEGDPKSIVDGDFGTSWRIKDWDGGVHYWNRMPIVTFDSEQTFDTMVVTTRPEESERHPLPNDAKLRVYDENGRVIKTIERQDIAVKHMNDGKGGRYAVLQLKEPITAKKVELNLSVYSGNNVSISELKFYNYGTLKNDVKNLFEDDLMISLREDVTQERIDELVRLAKTIDPVSLEYHPDQKDILADLQRAQDILNDVDLNDDIKVLDASINNTSKNNIGQSNNYQALGVAVKPGDKVNIYIGSDRANTEFDLVITQHNGESGTAYKVYPQKLRVGKNEITIPESAFNMDCEKGGNLYLSFAKNYHEGQNVKVRVSGGTKTPHLDLNNIIANPSKELEAKEKIRTYIRTLKSYVATLPDRYTEEADKTNNIYEYDPETSILNTTDIEGDRFTLSFTADQVLKGIESGLSTEEQQVNRLYDTLCAWEQLMQVSYAQQGLLEEPIDFNGNGQIDNTALPQLNGKSENQFFDENRAPRNRINIKYQRMFTGAFMYASSHHVGIGYGSIPEMMQGVPFRFDENGNLINTNGNLFGWGIGHEVGHVHDRPGLTYAETTNNILALITQTFNDIDSSRVEGQMEAVYDRVTSQSEGVPKGTVGLAMYWQLHLAYDNNNTYEMVKDNTDKDITNDTFFAKLYRVTREKGIASSEAGYDQTAQTFIMRCSDAVKKDLREFFARWGVVASPKTNAYLNEMGYPKEDKAIFYLNDEARRKRLEAINSNNLSSLEMAQDTKVEGTFANGVTDKSYIRNNSVPLEFRVNKDNDKILGYEIIRKESTSTGTKETPVGFVARNTESDVTTYTDVIDAVNNRTFEYKVRAYDYNLNVTETFDIGSVKVKHDGSIAKNNFTFDTNTRGVNDVPCEDSGHGHVEDGSINFIKDNDKNTVYNASKATDNNGNVIGGDPYITVDMGTKKPVVGLKYTPGNTETKKFSLKNLFKKNKEVTYSPITDYEVLVSEDGKNWSKAHSGTFDPTKENVIYFNEAGSNDNSQLWTYNAKYVKLIAKGSETISVAELDILGPPGDNIEIGVDNNDEVYKNGVGRLSEDYEYAEGKVIPKDSIIVTGEYTGDPAFNVPLILNEEGENFALQAQTILLANLPEGSQLGEVAEGNFIYWITPDQQGMINGEDNIKGKAIKAELYRYNKLVDGRPVGQRLVSDTFLVDLPSNLDDLPVIDLNSSKARRTLNYDKVIEIDNETMKSVFENR